MSHSSGNMADFGMDAISLAVREAGFSQIMLAARDLPAGRAVLKELTRRGEIHYGIRFTLLPLRAIQEKEGQGKQLSQRIHGC